METLKMDEEEKSSFEGAFFEYFVIGFVGTPWKVSLATEDALRY